MGMEPSSAAEGTLNSNQLAVSHASDRQANRASRSSRSSYLSESLTAETVAELGVDSGTDSFSKQTPSSGGRSM